MKIKKLVLVTLVAALALVILAGCSSSEPKDTVTVRFSEVIRSIFYAPHYIAIEKGFFAEEGIEVDMVTAQGSDRGAAALLAGTADISLIGPETALYINNQDGEKKLKIFYQLTGTDGSFLLSRNKMDNFKWSDTEGKTIISWRPGSSPQMVMASVLKKNNINAELVTNIAAPAMVGAYESGNAEFIQVYEPIASMLVSAGKAHLVASMGTAMGPFPQTTFIATSDFIEKNPDVIQRWSLAVYKAKQWMNASSADEIADALLPYFEGTAKDLIKMSVERYQTQNSWPDNPVVTEEQYQTLLDTLVENGVLKENQRLDYKQVIDPSFAKKAAGN